MVGTALAAVGAEQVDPCNPAERELLLPAEDAAPNRWLPARIRQLEDKRAALLDRISDLPYHAPRALSDHIGYHGRPQANGEPADGAVSRIDVQFMTNPRLGAIALAPALVPGREGNYAFPRRFKIDVMDREVVWVDGPNGKQAQPQPSYEWKEVVNWMDEDFPDPGTYPAFFFIGDTGCHQVRLTLLPDSASGPYCALGELYLFRNPEKDIDHLGDNGMDHLGDNMMAWSTSHLFSTNSLSTLPQWDASYLNDGVAGLGMPLSEKKFDAEDFMVSWPDSDSGPVQIVLDLGQERPAGRVQLWPAEAPHGMAVPHFGFPGQIGVELSKSPDFQDAVFFDGTQIRRQLHKDVPLNITPGAIKARYIRITLDEFTAYQGRKILGLGEIRVSEFDDVWSLNCGVEASGLPPDAVEQLPRLVDGFSRQRRILREADWIRGLALRRPLDMRLAEVEQELEVARDAWTAFKLRASIWGGALIGFGLLGAMGLQRLQRRKVLARLKHRITRDLHDDVGSSLGGLSLTAEDLEGMATDEVMKRELRDLSLMTREACASLREVVWVTDQGVIRLPALIEKMVERTERVLRGVKVMVDVASDVPEVKVSLTCKRHLIMLFREAVHNCARHAGANEVQVSIRIVETRLLEMSLQDDGCGFDPGGIQGGWGLESMKERAEELRGTMELRSAPGEGTLVRIALPLNVLSQEPTDAYKTSN